MRFRKDLIKSPELKTLKDSDKERHADWLELLYDLVFVAAISILALTLSSDYTFTGFLKSIPLFFVIWWGWVGHTFYLSRFGTNDAFHRFLTMLQMIAVAALAVNVKDAWGVNATGFAISYAILRFILVVEYWRAGHQIKEARSLTNHYCIGFGIAASLWLISAFLPSPWKFVLWAVALIIDLLTPITASEKHRQLPPHKTHLPERFGLFTIILIGEAVVSVVFTISDVGFNFLSETTGIMGLIIAFCIWWSYFEEARGAEEKVLESGEKISKYQLWLYSHFPLLLGIVTVADGIKHVINLGLGVFLPSTEVWLLCLSLALTFISLSFIHLSTFTWKECKNKILILFRLPYYIIIFLVILTGFLGNILPGHIILTILTALCLIKVILSLREPPQDLSCEL